MLYGKEKRKIWTMRICCGDAGKQIGKGRWMSSKKVIIHRREGLEQIENYPHVNSRTGKVLYQKELTTEPETGMMIEMIRYPKGCMIPSHTHHCGHGIYVLRGTLVTSEGNFKPGDYVWFDEGTVMTHGAGEEEDVDILFITNKKLDMNYL